MYMRTSRTIKDRAASGTMSDGVSAGPKHMAQVQTKHALMASQHGRGMKAKQNKPKPTFPVEPMSSHSKKDGGASTLTHQLSSYMIISLFHRMNVTPEPAAAGDHGLPYKIIKDCEMIVGQIYRAYSNPSESMHARRGIFHIFQ